MGRSAAWAARVTFPLSLLGLAVSTYLTWAHYAAGTALSCPDTGIVNCLKVTTSEQSRVAGVPVALLGAIFFAAMAFLCAPPAWSARNGMVARLRLLGAISGIGAVLYLVAVELLVVRAICLWCTIVHLTAFGLFAGVLAAFLQTDGPGEEGGGHRR